jgi:predicted amidohydrolase
VANWPEKRILHWETLLRARAIEHQCFVVGVNRIGKDGNGLQYSGQSMIIEYSGKSMLTINKDHENVKSLSLSKSALCIYREELPFLRDKGLDKN